MRLVLKVGSSTGIGWRSLAAADNRSVNILVVGVHPLHRVHTALGHACVYDSLTQGARSG